jgi:hypothetical protein
MSQKDFDDAILEQAEAIKKGRADRDAIVEKHRRLKMTWSDKFSAFWENKVITTVWIGIAIWGCLAFLGIVKTS